MSDRGDRGGDRPAPAPRCPVCRKPTDQKYRPFCSKRCADVDLARWLGGTYVIAGGASDEEGEAIEEPARKGGDDADA